MSSMNTIKNKLHINPKEKNHNYLTIIGKNNSNLTEDEDLNRVMKIRLEMNRRF